MLRLTIAVSCFLAVLSAPVLNDDLNEHWEMFKNVHSKAYGSQEEETLRRMIWEGHVDYIAHHNREFDMGLHTYTLGINEYADMSNEEFVSIMNGYRSDMKNASTVHFLPPSNFVAPDSVDWRTKGYVTEVKNQKQCGACWAFSTTGSLEGQHFKSTGKLVSLSEQNLVDCSKAEGNLGCGGGLMDNGFTYIKKNGGIDTEESYPYKAKNGHCHFEQSNVGATDSGYVDIKRGSEDSLMMAVASVGPVSVAIDASHTSFQLYRTGIYNERRCSSSRLDHGVLAVGYGTSTDGTEYWLVKNSWGTTWGKEGYVWMSKNKNNQCGIATQASYPTV
ncbi:cathepsin L-like [Watersipora subatra]|uniref:cathepsin L-like n=1 Tax=Watersipora subatra TaxID=2589382 RepID=UPI00355AD691